jgi:hypothetical protein
MPDFARWLKPVPPKRTITCFFPPSNLVEREKYTVAIFFPFANCEDFTYLRADKGILFLAKIGKITDFFGKNEYL